MTVMERTVGLLTAFTAGVLSFLSPCVLPLIPAYLSYLGGVSLQELKGADGLDAGLRWRLVGRVVLFVLGFSFVFVSLGATATALGRLFLARLDILMRVAGAVIILFGLHVAGWLRIPWLYQERRFAMATKVTSWVTVPLMGMAFGFGWTPCVGPILAAILAQAARQETVGEGVLLLAAYSAGLGLPFVVAGAAVGAFFGWVAGMRRHLRTVEVVSGILLVAVGLLIVVGRLGDLTVFFLRVFPFLGRLG